MKCNKSQRFSEILQVHTKYFSFIFSSLFQILYTDYATKNIMVIFDTSNFTSNYFSLK